MKLKKEVKDFPVIFMTGATGFLGGATLSYIIESKIDCRLILLVRGKNMHECMNRIMASVWRFINPNFLKYVPNNIEIIPGDLIDEAWHKEKCLNEVTHVLHIAANTSFGFQPSIRQTNIYGATAIANAMRKKPNLQRYFHIGTAMICGSNPSKIVYEDQYPKEGVRQFVTYTSTKAEAEKLLNLLYEEFPLIIVRPSIVVGHTRFGCQPSTSIFWFFLTTYQLQRTTWSLNNNIDIIPVDYAAAALTHLLLKPKLHYRRYHISAGENSSITWKEMFESFEKIQKETPRYNKYKRVKFSDDITEDQIRKVLGPRHPGDEKRMLLAIRLYFRFAALDTVFNNSRLLREGFRLPPRFTDYLPTCFKTSFGRDIYDQMQRDF